MCTYEVHRLMIFLLGSIHETIFQVKVCSIFSTGGFLTPVPLITNQPLLAAITVLTAITQG